MTASMKSSDPVHLLDDKVIEQAFRDELRKVGIARSSIPKRLYRAQLERYKVGWRKGVIEHLQKQSDEPL